MKSIYPQIMSASSSRIEKKRKVTLRRSRFLVSVFLFLILIIGTGFMAFATFYEPETKNISANSQRHFIDYRVQKGDTLWNIAKNLNDKLYSNKKDIRKIIYQIKKKNHMETGNIYVGQTLVLPSKTLKVSRK